MYDVCGVLIHNLTRLDLAYLTQSIPSENWVLKVFKISGCFLSLNVELLLVFLHNSKFSTQGFYSGVYKFLYRRSDHRGDTGHTHLLGQDVPFRTTVVGTRSGQGTRFRME